MKYEQRNGSVKQFVERLLKAIDAGDRFIFVAEKFGEKEQVVHAAWKGLPVERQSEGWIAEQLAAAIRTVRKRTGE